MSETTRPNSPSFDRPFEAMDEELAAELRQRSGRRPAHHPVSELLARHWVAVFSYARLCTSEPQYAGMLTTAAFARLFGEAQRQSGPTAAWRPQLLVAVRRIAGEWDADKRRALLHPGLLSEGGDAERAAARLLPGENRLLVARAFHRLPERARCLLWHAEVEAEDLAIPSALLRLEPADAPAQLERARAQLRDACAEAHRELAPEEECRRFNRLLDVSIQRGGASIDRDLRRHMARCAYCRHAADQLDQSPDRLAVLLAEGVLGWGARDYLGSRAGRRKAQIVEVSLPSEAKGGTGGDSRRSVEAAESSVDPRRPSVSVESRDFPPAGRGAARRVAPRRLLHGRNLILAMVVLSGCVVVPLVLWPGGGDGSGAGGGPAETVSPSASAGPGGQSSGIRAGGDGGALRGRLRNAETGLCVGIADGKATQGAEPLLLKCTSSPRQQWSYESDGLLRSVDAPGLCIDSRRGFSVRLGDCEDESGEARVRYDLTIQGNLLPRDAPELALASISDEKGAYLVLKTRTDGDAQRWQFDTSVASVQMEASTSYGIGDAATLTDTTVPSTSRTSPTTVKPAPSTAEPTAPASPSAADPCNPYTCWSDDDDQRLRDGGRDGGRSGRR